MNKRKPKQNPIRNLEENGLSPQWQLFFSQFKKNKIAVAAFIVFACFLLIAIYAPFLASSKPTLVYFDKTLYFPLFRYLFYNGFYTKPIDLFFNLLSFTFPLFAIAFFLPKKNLRKWIFLILSFLQISLFVLFLNGVVKNPESSPPLKQARKDFLEKQKGYSEDPLLAPFAFKKSWLFELQYLTDYEKLNLVLRYKQRKAQHERLGTAAKKYEAERKRPAATLWAVDEKNDLQKIESSKKILSETKEEYQKSIDRYPALIAKYTPYSHAFIMAKYELEHTPPSELEQVEKKFNALLKQAMEFRTPLISVRNTIETYQNALSELHYLEEKKTWLEQESTKLTIIFPALLRDFHWEDDAGGSQALNSYVPWWDLTRINRKDLFASLIFGVRVSLIVGMLAVSIALCIGIFLGMVAGYFAGKTDLVISRIIEIWEAMPTFFMLLLVVAITQTKSLFLVISVLGIFGWTGMGRFMRAEVLKQRNLPYVYASISMGFPHRKIMFSHILPNAIAPILTLLPFSMMAAITSEAGLSFLGLGEEGSTSWGVLMDEGRSVFPGESYLLWPPAILLTILLIAIALMGDAFRDAIDPKMRQ